MVLAYWGQQKSEAELATLLGTTPLGTPAGRLVRLQQFGFQVSYAPLTFSLLQAEIDQNRPVILLVRTIFLDYWDVDTAHAVLLVGYNEQQVWLHDPAFAEAPQIASHDGLLAAWGEFDYLAGIITP
jgi:ABC-type bacteriocin/lantibiotic exporter with double-glycine peptidase domain